MTTTPGPLSRGTFFIYYTKILILENVMSKHDDRIRKSCYLFRMPKTYSRLY